MDVVKFLGQVRRQAPVAVAGEKRSTASSQHAFIGGHPLHANAVRDGQHFLGDAALGRPDSLWTDAENFFVQVEPASQLLAGVFGMAKSILR